MFVSLHTRTNLVRILSIALAFLLSLTATYAQSSEDEIDPVKLFELGQDAHARGDFERAIELYARALTLQPAFPEAEYQRASALISIGRLEDAEKPLRRAIELRPEWALPYALLGSLMVKQKRFSDAEPFLINSLKLEATNPVALIALAEMRLQTKSPRDLLLQVLNQLRTATSEPNAVFGVWFARGSVERALGDADAALASYARVLSLDSRSSAALIERAEIFAGVGQIESAIESAKAAKQIAPASIYISTTLARLYLQTGNCSDASTTLDELDAVTKRPSETTTLRGVVTMECAKGDKERSVLETALVKEPRNSEILSRLCLLYRKDDPSSALEYCRRALEIQPTNVDYGTSFAAALVQARRFADAITVLRRVIDVAPDKFVAHANLAIALYELKRFPEALTEYKWICEVKPETTAAYFFIAVIYDKLGEFQNALSSYEDFLRRADAIDFKLEIDKVNLRLPSLRNQIKLGQGAKTKT